VPNVTKWHALGWTTPTSTQHDDEEESKMQEGHVPLAQARASTAGLVAFLFLQEARKKKKEQASTKCTFHAASPPAESNPDATCSKQLQSCHSSSNCVCI
jgi:hypothetical protein